MPWTWYDSKVIRIEDESSTTKRFWLEVPEENKIDFEPGQFVTMDLPISDKRLKRWRSYSIANAPDGTNVLEFVIVYLEGGGASEYLFNDVKVGTSIRFKGPSGTFTLPKDLNKELVFICTGTGIAPFRSMIQHLNQQKAPFKNIHLIFGTRYEEGILYRKEMEQLAEELSNFQYSIAISRQEDWCGTKGYVHQIYLEQYKEARPDIDFYLCGWSNMIDDAVANLIVKLGYDKSQVHYELYG